MFELPDKRAILVLAVVLAAGIASLVVPDASVAARPVQIALFGVLAGAGMFFAVTELLEGRCLNRPSVTRHGAPMAFWLESGGRAVRCFGRYEKAMGGSVSLRSNRSVDSDTHRQRAARRAGDRAPRGALPVRACQIQR